MFTPQNLPALRGGLLALLAAALFGVVLGPVARPVWAAMLLLLAGAVLSWG